MGQVLYFLQISLFIVICHQVHHSCIISKCDDGESSYKLICAKGVYQGAQNAALRCTSVKDECVKGVFAHPPQGGTWVHLGSARQEVKDPHAQ